MIVNCNLNTLIRSGIIFCVTPFFLFFAKVSYDNEQFDILRVVAHTDFDFRTQQEKNKRKQNSFVYEKFIPRSEEVNENAAVITIPH